MSLVACCDGDQQETLPGSGQRQERAPWEGACRAVMPSCSSARWPQPVSLDEESWPFGKQDVSTDYEKSLCVPASLPDLDPLVLENPVTHLLLSHVPTTPVVSFFRTLCVLHVLQVLL